MRMSTPTPTHSCGPWLARRSLDPEASLRLFCFPYAGGGASAYNSWSQSLPRTVEVCPVQIPGRETRLREQPFRRLGDLVSALAEGLSPWLDRPFAFFGHSMGATISFELARFLRREHRPEPVHLFVSGRRAPHMAEKGIRSYDLPELEFLDILRHLNGTPARVFEHQELLKLILPVLRADFELVQTYEYVPGPPLDCPISAFGGLNDPEADVSELEAWREYSRAPFSMSMFLGDHFYLHSAGPLVLRTLSQELDRVLKRAAASYGFTPARDSGNDRDLVYLPLARSARSDLADKFDEPRIGT